jgi:hypothetical protein
MERREFTQKLLALGVCPAALISFTGVDGKAKQKFSGDEDFEKIRREKEFIENWLSDLLDSMDKTIDRETQVKIIEGCGRGCFNRFQFKKDIAAKGEGNLEKLIDAYQQNFEIWKDENTVHIRYGETSKGCYCPAAKYRTPKTEDLHCECTRTTHQTIFETALRRPFKVDIAESLRRGGKTCHFIVHLGLE